MLKGIIVKNVNNNNRYLIKLNNGKLVTRNKMYLKPIPQANIPSTQHEVTLSATPPIQPVITPSVTTPIAGVGYQR